MELQHVLAPHYGELRRIKTRAQLHASALWARIGGEVEHLLGAVERGDRSDAKPPAGSLRAVAWNIQRGIHFDRLRAALQDDPVLREADVLLLSEVDNGLGRSGNRNVARDLADALGMSYAFAVSYLTLEDDHLENPEGRENTLALAGSAILSRAPIRRAINADLPELRDKFSSSEKRLGKKRAVIAELETASGPIVVAQAHLDSNASSRQRAHQLAALLAGAKQLDVPRMLVGGDFNTTTYNLESKWRMVKDILHKLVVTGFDGTVANYMTPDRRYELPLFAAIRDAGFSIDGWNDRDAASMSYDFSDPYTLNKVRAAVGGMLTRWLVRRLHKFGGVVRARLDWFAGHQLAAAAPRVVHVDGHATDHDAVVVDVAI
ncbi:MAG TPA: endonuclease/exonuclease/phosphatase family protein [Kofleriaceae bacterium]